MANPTLTPFPTPPLPEQDEVTFNRNAANSLLAQANFVTEGNIVITWMGQQVTDVASYKKAAADSAAAAAQALTDAQTQAGNAKTSAEAAARSLSSTETVAAAVRAQINLPSLVGQKGKFWRVAQDEKTLELADVVQTITKYFESSPQALLSYSKSSVTHGLGGVPKFVSAHLVCTAANLGFAVGDRVEVSTSLVTMDQNGNDLMCGFAISANATTIDILHSSFTPVIGYNPPTNNRPANLTADRNSWKLILRAAL